MNTTNQLQILVQSISFPMLPLFMPSQESIVTGEINFPLHESKLSPFLIPTVNYLPIAALKRWNTLPLSFLPSIPPYSLIPFSSTLYLSAHIHILSFLSTQYPKPSHISSQQTRKSMFTVWVKSGLHILQAHSNRSGSNSASLHSITSPRSITIFFACFSVISTDYITPPPSLLRSQWTYQRSHQSSARSSLLRGTFSVAACDR